jgi:hypothetical protein
VFQLESWADKGNHPWLIFMGIEINFKDNQLVNLTNMWKAAGSLNKKQPAEWLRQKGTKEFIQQVQAETKPGNSQVLKISPGKGGGTFAHWKLGLAYTAFLNPKVHSWFMDVVKERFEEIVDPDQRSSATNRAVAPGGSGLDPFIPAGSSTPSCEESPSTNLGDKFFSLELVQLRPVQHGGYPANPGDTRSPESDLLKKPGKTPGY